MAQAVLPLALDAREESLEEKRVKGGWKRGKPAAETEYVYIRKGVSYVKDQRGQTLHSSDHAR